MPVTEQSKGKFNSTFSSIGYLSSEEVGPVSAWSQIDAHQTLFPGTLPAALEQQSVYEEPFGFALSQNQYDTSPNNANTLQTGRSELQVSEITLSRGCQVGFSLDT